MLQVGVSKDGMIQALDVRLYNNAGCGWACSLSVMERATKHVENAYYIPNVSIEGFACRTNIASNTAFRGFGSPQVGSPDGALLCIWRLLLVDFGY